MLPLRGGVLRQGCAWNHPPTPVSKGGAGQICPPRSVERRARAAYQQRGGDFTAAGAALSQNVALRRRHRGGVVQDLRSRGLASWAGLIPGDLFLLQFRGLPGASGQYSLQTTRQEQE